MERRFMAHDHILARQRQLNADPDMLPVLATPMWSLDEDTAADDVGVEGLKPGRSLPDDVLQCFTRLHVAERDLYRPDHDLRPLISCVPSARLIPFGALAESRSPRSRRKKSAGLYGKFAGHRVVFVGGRALL
jgi:hypothetical protein